MSQKNSPTSSKDAPPEPRFKKLVVGANDLSLGISIVLAVLMGVGIGWVLQHFTGIVWLFWLGVAWGVGGAVLNIYKAYQRAKKEFDTLAQDPKYSYTHTKNGSKNSSESGSDGL
ncbi:hypothetical protein BKH46_07540 [Helicobacter sp. 12S02634-8]|uniref:AtpZ/AtpI family protein n=1 Tax=Helicobacter sp. 12S02634-8 TaxID=1476199 RepID=UPI000BA5E1F9|nr:AtpZ/AtpI family protein [Helicobacter sp. 12S02634-8]PAF46433.1 hypothetical protein BKH46_07540 [Helicobacter sp. 12S02634-8]